MTKRPEAAHEPPRERGFYLVEDEDDLLSIQEKRQPAFWDGKHWWITGWDCWVIQTFKVIRKLELEA